MSENIWFKPAKKQEKSKMDEFTPKKAIELGVGVGILVLTTSLLKKI